MTGDGEIYRFELNGVKVHAVKEPTRLCSYLAQEIREFKPDWTLVSSEDRSQSLLETALKAHLSRVIYLAHTPQMFPFGPASLYPGNRRTELIGQAAAIITISRFVADYIKQWTGFESFVNHPPHYGSAPFPNLGAIENEHVLMMNACAVKGISIFLALARAMPNVKFAALPGWGTTAADRAALAELGNVSLLSNCQNLDDVFQRTRVVLMPSLWVEGFGMAVVDAMLRGIPVLASHHGGLIEAKLGTDYLLPVKPIESFEDRLDDNLLPVPIVSAQDLGPWENALSSLLSDRSLYEKQSTEARAAALRFVAELDIKPLEDLLLRLAKEVNTQRRYSLGREDNQGTSPKGKAGRIGGNLADLSPEQQALLMLRLRKNALKRAKPEASTPPTKPVLRDQKFPLSFAQQRLWFLDRYEPGKPFYNISQGLRLSGRLDIEALERSLNEIIRRHEVLRTTFSMEEDEPVQRIAQPVNRSLARIDLRDRAVSEREDEARRIASEEARRPFDLGRGPLFRATLVRLGEDDHVLVLTVHHIVADGWSMAVLNGELAVLYEAFRHSEPSPLSELPIQYADYAVWQREWLQGEVLDGQVSYWKKQLEGAPAVLDLPTDRPRPAVQSYRGARSSFELSKELTEQLKALSRKENATLFMTLLAAFQALLYRYTGQQDIVVGSPIANRSRVEIEGLIGFFVNTLVLRTDLSGNPSFRELLRRVRKTALEAYDHQDLPFEKLVEELNPERSLSHSPLFQVMFVLQNVPVGPGSNSDLVIHPERLENDTTKFDLSVSLVERSDGLKGWCEYSTDLFNEGTIVRLGEHFRMLLEGLTRNPDRLVGHLPMLTEAETHKLILEWNETKREYPRNKCIHELFEEQVKRTPEAVAVVFDGEELKYRELNRRANQVARYLIKLGARPETLVAICMERSLEMIVGILGILKAGAAYVPQDPCFPNERLAYMWDDTRVTVLLSQEHLAETLPPFAGSVVCIDRDWEPISRESDADIKSGATPENLAYVIYTSGSTGRPKGVQIPHSNVINALTHVRAALGFTQKDISLLVANICFDISVMELLLPLVVGARLVVVGTVVVVDGERLARLVSSCEATMLHATPATWRLLLQAGWTGDEKLTILCGGEALPSELAKRLAGQGSSLWNLYGPTETTIYSTGAVYQPELCDGTVSISIGRPVANTQIYILDDYLQPVPVGVPGQLCIGGAGLARGYLDRAELTAASFIPNPFSEEPGARMYRTGDLTRYLPDGRVEYLGRLDHQVKLRGFRIELGEIESVLSEHPQVRHSVVLAREDVPDDKQLTAYIVLDEGATAGTDELRRFLKAKLPEYMVPSAYVYLESLPLTSNGKLDRKALPAPDPIRPDVADKFVAPRTLIEETLANIWAEVLGFERVGVHDNFFDLGGHSLLGAQVMSRAREALQVDLPLRILFEAPTVVELALRVECSILQAREPEQLERSLAEVESLSEADLEQRLKESK
ncbi:MAG: amino acid adenylation domain-containing protein [Candidatus Binatia bacterium]